MRTRKTAAPGGTALLLASLLLGCGGSGGESNPVIGGSTSTGNSCAPASHPGGDWPMLNLGLDNTRYQRAEKEIDVGRARALEPAWAFSVASEGAPGGIQTTPIVANGCVYIATGYSYLGPRGDVFALNADDGRLVWHVELNASVLSLAAANGLIYATPSNGTRGEVFTPTVNESFIPTGSHVIALDALTGRRAWISERLDDGTGHNGSFVTASPVVYKAGGKSIVFVPLSGGGGDGARVPMYFLDALTGKTLKKSYSLTEAEYQQGFGGTGIWSTAAYDTGTGYLYAGTADSDAHTKQHPYNNAILKIDGNPGRSTFGSVVAAYSGTTEYYDVDRTAPVFESSPVCQQAGGSGSPFQPPVFFDSSASSECLELDLDFGASINLFTDAAGQRVVSALQKSGVFHVVRTDTMESKWTMTLSPGGAANNSATAAVGDSNIYAGATPNTLFALGQESGTPAWVSSTGVDAFAYQPLTLANGVLYTINDPGFFMAFDAASGAPLLNRLISEDAGVDLCTGVGAGIAVARNTVYVPCDAGGRADAVGGEGDPGALVAYR